MTVEIIRKSAKKIFGSQGLSKKMGGLLFVALLSASAVTQATVLRVTIQNNAAENGLAFTPVFSAFHGASYDAFDVGGTASEGLEALAELGMTGGTANEANAADAGNVNATIFPDGGMRPFFPGETGSALFDITDPASNMFFTFLSMILPSNDTFFGNDDAVQIFDSAGVYLGNKTIEITGEDLYDAGTEALDILAAPFIPGNSPLDSPADSNPNIRAAESLAAFAGLTLANGSVLDAALIDFLTDPAAFSVATITIEQVSAPSLSVIALMLIGGMVLRRKA